MIRGSDENLHLKVFFYLMYNMSLMTNTSQYSYHLVTFGLRLILISVRKSSSDLRISVQDLSQDSGLTPQIFFIIAFVQIKMRN